MAGWAQHAGASVVYEHDVGEDFAAVPALVERQLCGLLRLATIAVAWDQQAAVKRDARFYRTKPGNRVAIAAH